MGLHQLIPVFGGTTISRYFEALSWIHRHQQHQKSSFLKSFDKYISHIALCEI